MLEAYSREASAANTGATERRCTWFEAFHRPSLLEPQEHQREVAVLLLRVERWERYRQPGVYCLKHPAAPPPLLHESEDALPARFRFLPIRYGSLSPSLACLAVPQT